MLYMTTKLSNPKYTPEAWAQKLELWLQLSMKGFEVHDHCCTLVVHLLKSGKTWKTMLLPGDGQGLNCQLRHHTGWIGCVTALNTGCKVFFFSKRNSSAGGFGWTWSSWVVWFSTWVFHWNRQLRQLLNVVVGFERPDLEERRAMSNASEQRWTTLVSTRKARKTLCNFIL